MSYHKVPNSYDKPNKRVVWLPSKENALISINKELHSNASIVVDPLSVNLSLTSKYTNSLDRGALETSTALFPYFNFSPSCKTPIAIQLAKVNMSLARQLISINIPMPYDQGMEKSAESIIEPLAILYDNN